MARKKLEKDVEKQVVEYAKATGWFCTKIVSPGTDAMPDRVFIHSGTHLWAEMKREGEEARLKQEYRMNQMRLQGAICFTWDNFKDAKKYLDAYRLL